MNCCFPRVIEVQMGAVPGQKGQRGFSQRYCASIEANASGPLSDLKPADDPQVGDFIFNSSGQVFQITEVDLDVLTFTVGELLSTVNPSVIQDAITSADTTWSSAKIAERLGVPVDFVQTFETELNRSDSQEGGSNGR